MARLVLVILAALLASACVSTGRLAEGVVAEGSFPGSKAASSPPRMAQRMWIQTAATRLEVDDLKKAVSDAEALVAAVGGTVSSSNIRHESADLQVRIPAARLRSFLDSVAELGEEQGRSTTSTDVTDSYSDLEAEISNLRALRDRLRTLLDRAKKVEEVLSVERELTRVQTKLDSLEARRQRMAADVQHSGVSLHLFEKPEKPAKPAPRILGPLGLLYEGTTWLVRKLFVISP